MEINKETIEILKAWNQITQRRLRAKAFKLGLADTRSLIASIDLSAIDNQINLRYNYYGMFVDMGVGKNAPLGNQSKRKPRKWYSPTIYREVAKLSEILAKEAGENIQAAILSESIDSNTITLHI
jgi:hypothetical protein